MRTPVALRDFLAILFGLLCTCGAGAQTLVAVRSAQTNGPLTYASVFNRTKNKLYFTNEEGMVKGPVSPGDTLTVSFVGYTELTTVITRADTETLQLREAPSFLNPVRITSCKRFEPMDYDNLSGDGTGREFGGVSWNVEAMNAKMAVLIRPREERVRLDAFSFWLKPLFRAPKAAIGAPMIFSFYQVDDSTHMPGELLDDRRIVYHPKKEGKQTIRLDTLSLSIPPSGLYLCLEYVFDERYQWPMRYVDEAKGIDMVRLQFGTRIDGVFSDRFPLVFYNYRNDQWFFPGRRTKEHLFQVQGTIRFSARLAVCRDPLP